MNVTRYWNPDAIRPVHVVMIALACAMLAGGFLLVSVPETQELVDGARPWGENSLLRSVVQLLCLNYEYPARHGDAVKGFCLMFFSGAALLVVGVVLATRPRVGEEVLETDIALPSQDADASEEQTDGKPKRTQIAPLIAAQMMAGIYLLWMLLRSLSGSSAPTNMPAGTGAASSVGTLMALGATAVTAASLLWSFSLGATLTRAAARLLIRGVILISVVSALIALWYFYGRNPTIRAKFPFTNPTFLGACLLPGMVLSLIGAYGALAEWRRSREERHLGKAGISLLAAAAILWPFLLAGSRGALVGLAFGLLAAAFLVLPARLRWTTLATGVVLIIAGAVYVRGVIGGSSQTGRDATARVRFYGWSYAVDLFQRHPVMGCGPGGFTLGVDNLIGKEWTDDALKRSDVEEDPRALSDRLGHAHSEWLEILAELGSVGFVLMLAILALTFMAVLNALETQPPPAQRFALVGLMSALSAMIVEECFGVGLRLGETPCAFFTVLGLTWAMCVTRQESLLTVRSKRHDVRIGSSIGAFALGAVIVVLALMDFSAARAAHDAALLARQNKLDEALARYESAERQLRPDRAMMDMMLYCETSLIRARALQDKAFDLSYRAQQDEASRQALLAEAQSAFEECHRRAKTANELLRDIHIIASGFMGASRLSADLMMLNWRFSQALNKQEEAASYMTSAAGALKLELARQPFDPQLAAQYVQLGGTALDFQTAVIALARPLRHRAVTNDYITALTGFADATPGFDDAFSGMYDRAMGILDKPTFEPADVAERWSPEIVRLGGILQLAAAEHAGAVKSFTAVVQAYEKFGFFRSAPMGSAYAVAELADAQFLLTPESPLDSIATIDRAFTIAPEGEEGDLFRLRNKLTRKAAYLAAAGREDEAKALIREVRELKTDDEVNRALASTYVELVSRVRMRKAWDIPDKTWTWVARAIELNPSGPAAHFLAANLCILDGNCDRAESSLRAALKFGANAGDVLGAINVLYTALPGCEKLIGLWKEIAPNEPFPSPPEYGPQPQPAEGEEAKDAAAPPDSGQKPEAGQKTDENPQPDAAPQPNADPD